MQECQMMHWKAHKRECSSVTTANNYMFGKPGYTKNKEKYECPPIRYDVVDVKGSKLSLSKTIMGKTGIREFTCEQDILETVIAYFENGRGCSVDIQREADGRDIVSASQPPIMGALALTLQLWDIKTTNVSRPLKILISSK